MFNNYPDNVRGTLKKLYGLMEKVGGGYKMTAKDKREKSNARRELRSTGILSLPFSLNPKRWKK